MRPPAKRLWLLPVLLFSTICCDQMTKYVARSVLITAREIPFLKGLVTFALVENHGGFLGIANNLPGALQFFFLNICVALLLVGCLTYLLCFSAQNQHTGIPLAFITGGGLSNLLDRLIGNGGVTDFIIVGLGDLQTGIFNLADVFILFGSFYLGFLIFRRAGNESR
jgi:signal peptidase II